MHLRICRNNSIPFRLFRRSLDYEGFPDGGRMLLSVLEIHKDSEKDALGKSPKTCLHQTKFLKYKTVQELLQEYSELIEFVDDCCLFGNLE